MTAARTASDAAPHELHSTMVTIQLGAVLSVLLGLIFLSGGLFYLYVFAYDIGPYFTATRLIHFYVGLASIPFLIAKYAATGFRFAGYYLRLPRFKRAGPPALIPRVFSPLLALDFFVLYFSGLYMLFHYYYTVTNIPPFEFKPVQVHLWAALVAVPLLAIHLGWHLAEVARGLFHERQQLRAVESMMPEGTRQRVVRRSFLGAVTAAGVGLAFGFQNTGLVNWRFRGLFIGRIPREERGGPGGFPVETLFGRDDIDVESWRLTLIDAAGGERNLSYADLMALPAVTRSIRISCVSGWSSVPVWSGPTVDGVLGLVEGSDPITAVDIRSVRGYGLTWARRRLRGDRALLATHVNGAPLSLNHGFPVRLIVPGYPGQNMVKQISRIAVLTEMPTLDPDFKIVQAPPAPERAAAPLLSG